MTLNSLITRNTLYSADMAQNAFFLGIMAEDIIIW
jgi:hypothetical protein